MVWYIVLLRLYNFKMGAFLYERAINIPRVVYEYGIGMFFENVHYMLAAIGIGVGAMAVAWFWVWLGEWIIRMRHTKNHKFNSRVRFTSITFASLTIVFGFGVASSAAGANFWNIILIGGILSMVGNYAFGGALKNAGAFIILSATNKIEDGWFVRGNGYMGFIHAIHIFWTEIKTKDGTSIIYVPTFYFFDTIFTHVLGQQNLSRKQPYHYI